jgi:hypothetical protein
MRPSALPMLSRCPKFVGGPPRAFTDSGTSRHKLFHALLALGPEAVAADPLYTVDLDEQDIDGVQWAVDYVHANAPVSDYPLALEKRVALLNDDFEEVTAGTPDAVCGPNIFDLKWRYRDYFAQMAAYAAAVADNGGFSFVKVHTLFGEQKRPQVSILSRADALAVVARIGAQVASPNAEARPCDYCDWCERAHKCEALIARANGVVTGREDWALEQYHASEITTAEQMGKALTVARQVEKWCKAVEYHAKQMAEKKGVVPVGFKLGTTHGKTWCGDVPRAFQLAGVPQEDFLRACDLRLNTSKKYPDKVGLIDIFAAQLGVKKTPAARQVKERLTETLKKGSDGVKLVAIKGEQHDEDDDET